MPLQFFQGRPLLGEGALAMHEDCCCNFCGHCCLDEITGYSLDIAGIGDQAQSTCQGCTLANGNYSGPLSLDDGEDACKNEPNENGGHGEWFSRLWCPIEPGDGVYVGLTVSCPSNPRRFRIYLRFGFGTIASDGVAGSFIYEYEENLAADEKMDCRNTFTLDLTSDTFFHCIAPPTVDVTFS